MLKCARRDGNPGNKQNKTTPMIAIPSGIVSISPVLVEQGIELLFLAYHLMP